VSDWGGPEHTEPLAYARRLSLNLVCELTRRWRPSATDTRPNGARQMCTSHFNCDMQPDAVPKHDVLTM
jgi:hypothetical protein